MYPLFAGMLATLALVAGTLFLRAYMRGRDRFFAFFAAAFILLGVTSLALGIRNAPEIDEPLAYVPRLAVFALILLAIFDKNRSERRSRRSAPVTDLRYEQRRRSMRLG